MERFDNVLPCVYETSTVEAQMHKSRNLDFLKLFTFQIRHICYLGQSWFYGQRFLLIKH